MTVPALFESIQESLHKIISSKLSTLPLFDKKDHKLVDDISKRYSQDMDAVELYSKRYLFGIRKKLFTTKQRETILEEYIRRKHGPSSNISIGTSIGTNSNTIQTETPILPNMTDPTFHVPSLPKDIPTEEQIKDLDEEITSLRQELRNAKAKSNFYTSRLLSIQNVRNHTQHATNIITQPQQQSQPHEHKDVNHYADKMIDSVTAAMIGKEGLNDMTTKGKHLLTEMTFITSQKEENNETAEFSQLMKAKAKALSTVQSEERPSKKLTLEEDFDQRKDQLRVGTNDSNIVWKK
jgi:hypothetical protein